MLEKPLDCIAALYVALRSKEFMTKHLLDEEELDKHISKYAIDNPIHDDLGGLAEARKSISFPSIPPETQRSPYSMYWTTDSTFITVPPSRFLVTSSMLNDIMRRYGWRSLGPIANSRDYSFQTNEGILYRIDILGLEKLIETGHLDMRFVIAL